MSRCFDVVEDRSQSKWRFCESLSVLPPTVRTSSYSTPSTPSQRVLALAIKGCSEMSKDTIFLTPNFYSFLRSAMVADCFSSFHLKRPPTLSFDRHTDTTSAQNHATERSSSRLGTHFPEFTQRIQQSSPPPGFFVGGTRTRCLCRRAEESAAATTKMAIFRSTETSQCGDNDTRVERSSG